MAKRKKPKNYLETSFKEMVEAVNILHARLTSVESVFATYIEWMKHEKKFKKYLEKKYKDNSSVQSEKK